MNKKFSNKNNILLRNQFYKFIGIAFWIIIFLPISANAHKLLVDFSASKEGIWVEAFFPDGKPAKDIAVRLLKKDKSIVLQSKTNQRGGHLFKIEKIIDYVADADAGLGHFAKVDIPASELTMVEVQKDATSINSIDSKPDALIKAKRPSKIKKEPLPFKRIILGIFVLAILGGIGVWASKRKRVGKEIDKC